MKTSLITKINLGYAAILALLLFVGVIASQGILQAQLQHRLILTQRLPAIESVRELISDLRAMDDDEYSYFIPGKLHAAMTAFDQASLAFDQAIDKGEATLATTEQRHMLTRIDRLYEDYLRTDRHMRQDIERGQVALAITTNNGPSSTRFDQISSLAFTLRDMVERQIEQTLRQEDASMTTESWVVVGTATFAFLLSLAISWSLSAQIRRAFQLLQEKLSDLSHGEFPLIPAVAPFEKTTELANLRESYNRTSMQLQALNRALTDSKAELELKVQDRTAQLAAAVEDLKLLDKAKSDFHATVTHELLTPINFITGFGSALLDGLAGPLSPQQEQLVSKIVAGADRLTGLVRNILDYSRLDAGDLAIRIQTVDYGSLLQDALEPHRELTLQKDQLLTVQVPENLAFVKGDPARVAQILFNLLDNAVKFTPKGGQIQVKVSEQPGWVITEVVDNGIGIPFQAISKLFEPFYQVDNSSTRAFGGAGLGLAIAKKLLTLQGGWIEVQSTPGEGSTFRFGLPMDLPRTSA